MAAVALAPIAECIKASISIEGEIKAFRHIVEARQYVETLAPFDVVGASKSSVSQLDLETLYVQ